MLKQELQSLHTTMNTCSASDSEEGFGTVKRTGRRYGRVGAAIWACICAFAKAQMEDPFL